MMFKLRVDLKKKKIVLQRHNPQTNCYYQRNGVYIKEPKHKRDVCGVHQSNTK